MSSQQTKITARSADLRNYTSARVSLDRTGSSIRTGEVLDFQLAHAQARDAVNATLDVGSLLDGLRQRGFSACALRSAAPTREVYLRHPDLGRKLSADSLADLRSRLPESEPHASRDLVIVVADGLSALAVNRHALALLDALLPQLGQNEWTIGPVCVVEQGRVAIGDAIGDATGAKISVVLIGERPGLSSPDSLGIYITWSPRPSRTDAERNCISNIRPQGLNYTDGANVLAFYLREARRQKLTGVGLRQRASLPRQTPAGS